MRVRNGSLKRDGEISSRTFETFPFPFRGRGGLSDGSGARGGDGVGGSDRLSKEEVESVNGNVDSGTVVDSGVSVLELGRVK